MPNLSGGRRLFVARGAAVAEVVAGDGIAVDNTDPSRPVVSATGGAGSQQVFIGTPDPLPAYPALVFEPATIDGQTVYRMRLNDGAA